MDKKEYLNLKQQMLHEILQIKNQLHKLDVQYINESNLSTFTVGEKVRVVKSRSGGEYGFVIGAEVNSAGEPVLRLKKCKKDGSMSKLDLYYIPEAGDKVEKI